jgi:hypothetical protein
VKRTLLLLSLCVVIPIGSAWAAVIGSTNAADFGTGTVDWCVVLGCTDPATLDPPLLAPPALAPAQGWTSLTGLDSGLVFVTDGVPLGTPPNPIPSGALYNLVQGRDWFGNFADGMGLVYNGAASPFGGSAPGPIFMAFQQDQIGVGAYIESNLFGSFSATIELFDIGGNSLGSFTTSGQSDTDPTHGLFIGAASVSGAARYASFSASAAGVPTGEPNFAIGTMQLGLGCQGGDSEPGDDEFCREVEDTIPEPASLLLLTPALLGLVAFTRRRRG